VAAAPALGVPTTPLNNGVEIPQLGFGVFQIPPGETVKATTTALEIGIPRDEVFVTSKLNNNRLERDDILRAFDKSLTDLDFEYLDLFLIHSPLPGVSDYVARWTVMEEIYASGRVRAIGVSNFQPHHLRTLLGSSEVRPAVNQIEVHPYLTQNELRAFDAEHEIVTEAWAPIARGRVNDDPAIREVARQIGGTPAQVTLRWHVQRGDVVFPKSVTRSRVEENFGLFDFELDESAMAAISGLNRDERTGPDPDEFNYVPG